MAKALVRVVLAACCGGVEAQETPRERTLVFAFRDASVDSVLLYVSRLTGWVFVLETPARGTITAVSETDVPVSNCLEFLSVSLRPHGLAVVNPAAPRLPQPGDILRVVDASRAGLSLPEVHVGLEATPIPLTSEFRTQVFPLKAVGVADLMKDLGDFLRRMAGDGAAIGISTGSNALIVSARSECVRRIAEILTVMDQAGSAQLRIEILPLGYADAAEVARTLNDLYKTDAPASAAPAGPLRFLQAEGTRPAPPRPPAYERVRITPEPRTNSIVVCAADDHAAAIRGLVAKLDIPSAALSTYVIPLRNTDAAAIAAMLNSLWNRQSTSAASGLPRSDGTLAPGQTAVRSPAAASGSRSGATSPRR
ncbi:MAG TPA: secretin N-terminal domain-containing protein [Planctomycetota bacterium]|nr:secretin N-terminal domain-containing protein [Planctomycetota bacterium]